MDKPKVPVAAYRCIVADPPWEFSRGTKITDHYATVSLEELKGMRPPAERNAHLWMWTTNAHLASGEALELVRAWDFKPMTILTWVKTDRGLGLGFRFRNSTEHVIFAQRGDLRGLSTWPATHFSAPRGPHSAKPDALLYIAEQVSPGPRLEMFARRRRDGWDVSGDQAPTAAQTVVGL